MAEKYDAVVVGSGPNGLSAAIALCKAGIPTLVLEAAKTPGGGSRTSELTLPGFMHDDCSTVHPLGAASPYFRTLSLERFGLSWVESPAAVAHVFDEHAVYTLERSVEHTAAQFGRDATAYRDLMQPFVSNIDQLLPMVLGPLRFPSSPWLMARFGLQALEPFRNMAAHWFRESAPRALLAGVAAHAMLPLDAPATSSFALVLGCAGHAVGWPVARGGSVSITRALVECLRAHGGDVVVERPVTSFAELPKARAYLFDLTPSQLLKIAGERLPSAYRGRLGRFRHGPGVFKMDWALSGPIPWRHPACKRAFTVHLAGDYHAVAEAEAAPHHGRIAERPFVLVVQPTLFDASRAPAGRHIAWAYCHVPHGSPVDASAAMEAQIERFAPGFRDLVLARHVRTAVDLERYNPNYVGGDITGGVCDLRQLFFRPVLRADPYATPVPDMFFCSSSTPPGGGVHGMCGYWAARSVLSRVFKRAAPPLAREVALPFRPANAQA